MTHNLLPLAALGSALQVSFKPALFWMVYYPWAKNNEATDPTFFLSALWLVAWVGSGYGYLVSLSVHPKNANLTAVMIAIMFGAFLGGVAPSLNGMPAGELFLTYFSYGRWGTELLVLNFCAPTGLVHARCTDIPALAGGPLISNFGYSYDDKAGLALFMLGLFSRILSCLLLLYTQRDEQVQ
jgi:hypothetical protein